MRPENEIDTHMLHRVGYFAYRSSDPAALPGSRIGARGPMGWGIGGVQTVDLVASDGDDDDNIIS